MMKVKSFAPNVAPIANLTSLASLLDMALNELEFIANNMQLYYRNGKLLKKRDGNPRPTHDAKAKLKLIHEKIKNRLLRKATYPYYVMGGIYDPMNPRSCKGHALNHVGKKILISEDIADFFPSVSYELVRKIWQYAFHFSPEVSELLAKLTTHEINGIRQLPQGWRTSGYLANLAFFDVEPALVEKVEVRGFTYSRFMDDITVSSNQFISFKKQSQIVSLIYAMLYAKGFKPKRAKHQIVTKKDNMSVTGLLVNHDMPRLSKEERKKIRVCVFQLEHRFKDEHLTEIYAKDWRSASGKVARVNGYHANEGSLLRDRLNKIKPPKHMLNPFKNKNDCKNG